MKARLDTGRFQVALMTEISELERYDALRVTLGDGEAASLALAECRGWFIACDEKRRFRREAEARIGADRILNTVSLLVLAILGDLVTVEEADVFKERLAERRFHIRVASFADLLPPMRS